MNIFLEMNSFIYSFIPFSEFFLFEFITLIIKKKKSSGMDSFVWNFGLHAKKKSKVKGAIGLGGTHPRE